MWILVAVIFVFIVCCGFNDIIMPPKGAKPPEIPDWSADDAGVTAYLLGYAYKGYLDNTFSLEDYLKLVEASFLASNPSDANESQLELLRTFLVDRKKVLGKLSNQNDKYRMVLDALDRVEIHRKHLQAEQSRQRILDNGIKADRNAVIYLAN